MKVYIDTNVFIYSMFADPRIGPHCKRLIDEVEQGRIHGVVSQLVPIEVLSVAIERNPSKAETALAAIYSLPLMFVGIDQPLLMAAARIARRYKLTGYDATHVAAALLSKTDVLVSNDQALKRVKEIRVVKPGERSTDRSEGTSPKE
ncbi:MAG: type II toxin-antitoxin system VapC family toxin [Candidatus Bathyarchaeia archaeon]